MEKNKFKILFARFPYGFIEHPAQVDWLVAEINGVSQIPLIDRVATNWHNGTPITAMRNKVTHEAIQSEFDIIVMLDNDNIPSQGFVESSFDFFYKRYDEAPSVIAAPYCGPPPYENVYVFQWEEYSSDDPENAHKLLNMNRNEVVNLTGISPAAAVPTGCVFVDLRIYTGFKGVRLPVPWFYYEYEDEYQAKVKSTEDVTWSRNIAALYKAALGLDTVFVNWDNWAAHSKNKVIGKPSGQYPRNIKTLFDNVAKQGI